MISRIKMSQIFRIGVAALIVLLLAGLSAGADTRTQTTDADFGNGETFMVEIDGDALKLARGLNNQWHGIGEVEGDYFGYSVASAGDVNGDGYDDVIVGAYGSNDGGNDVGKAYVYLGSASGLSTTAAWAAAGEAVDDYFGYSVASAGDVNDDGYDDVIVGAYGSNDGSNDAGKAYVYLGSAAGPGTTASWTATGDAAYDYFGASVASAGDVNDDGYDDVIVGAYGSNDGSNDAGKAYVYLGSASGPSTTVSWTATGAALKDYFGYSVASAGDVNGDGYVDIIVGAYGNSDARSNAGKAHVYLGSASGLNTTASWTATCNASYDYFGSSVASAGDVNGDGYYDVIVGAPDNDTGGNNAGKSYVYLGSASGLSTTVSWTAIGEVSADRFGSSVASAGDVNDDGYGDVIVGAYGNNDGGNNAGKSYVYLGSASGLSTTASWTAAGDAAYDYFGSSVASAGDLDGDGYGDIIVGAYRNNYGGSDAGKVYTYQNLDLWTLEVVKWTAAGDAAGDYFGSSVTSAGDVNGDGYRDVVVGAPEHDSGGSDAGKAYVYLGSASGLSTTAQWTATGDAAGDYFGSSVASAGDVNGDGYGDIVVSAPNNNDNGNDAGKAYVYLGSATGLSTTASWTETGARVVDYFGSSVSSAGDVNGDGYGDVIVGAQYNDDGGKNVGKAYVYLGSASGLSKMVQWTAIGEDLYDRFGESVAPAGDVNDDGYDDVIVGAPYNDDGGNNAGKSYVYLGSASGLGTIASWAEIGDAAKDYFGATVASAGDVDGDGYGDVIVSAHGNDDGSNDAGKAYGYLGSATGLSTTASWTETGEVAGDYFGSSVASAGDVDGDGYDDVIVSAHGNNDGSNDAGKVYVYGGIGYCEHGLFVSEKFGMSDSTIVKWINISWNPAVQPYGTGARFQIGTSNDGKSFVYLGPDGTANTYYTDPAGQTIHSKQVGKVWRYKALLYSDERKVQTPTITDVSIVYEM
ncbi:MAG: hypothetical protein C5S49_01955 [Candidatus Methanogaster sp.]|nr:MAG: hypothetical protein C5S49_01955 [ANME-2 cluster archaeon]